MLLLLLLGTHFGLEPACCCCCYCYYCLQGGHPLWHPGCDRFRTGRGAGHHRRSGQAADKHSQGPATLTSSSLPIPVTIRGSSLTIPPCHIPRPRPPQPQPQLWLQLQLLPSRSRRAACYGRCLYGQQGAEGHWVGAELPPGSGAGGCRRRGSRRGTRACSRRSGVPSASSSQSSLFPVLPGARAPSLFCAQVCVTLLHAGTCHSFACRCMSLIPLSGGLHGGRA